MRLSLYSHYKLNKLIVSFHGLLHQNRWSLIRSFKYQEVRDICWIKQKDRLEFDIYVFGTNEGVETWRHTASMFKVHNKKTDENDHIMTWLVSLWKLPYWFIDETSIQSWRKIGFTHTSQWLLQLYRLMRAQNWTSRLVIFSSCNYKISNSKYLNVYHIGLQDHFSDP